MSKISDLMNAMRRVIDGSDRSNTPQLRKIAETYAAACGDAAARLEECRALLSAGLPVDARSVNVSMSPPLAERVRALTLTNKERKIWQELCRLYHYPEAAELDVETARLLDGAAGEDGRDSGRLIMRWRKIARTGAPLEKIALLRQIIRAVPDNAAIWRDNLRQVERQFVAEIVKELPQILHENNPQKIMRIFETLSDPELSVKPPEEALSKLRPVVTAIQREELAEKLHCALDAITGAYSALDETGTRAAVAEYDKLSSHPLHAPSAEELRQLREVRQYLEESRRHAENAAKAQRETAELFALLDDHGPLDRINMLYESLRQLDLPLAKTLAERVEARREADAMEAARCYHRRGLLAVLAAILLLAAGTAAVVILNWFSECRNTASAWEKQLTKSNPAAVLEMYEKLKQEKPRLLKFGRLRELQMEAQRQEEERLANAARSLALLEESESLLAMENVDFEELAKRVAALTTLPKNAMTPEAEKRLRRVTQAFHALELQRRQARDREFTQQWTELVMRCTAWQTKLSAPEMDYDSLAAESNAIFADGEALFRNAGQCSQNLYESRRTAWRERREGMEKQLAEEQKRREYLAGLTAPRDFRSYAAALEALPARMPQMALGEWKTALTMLPAFRALALSANYGSRWRSRAEFDDKAREIQPFLRSTPFTEDVRMLLPARFAERLNVQKNELEKRLGKMPEVYEVKALDRQRKPYYFYTALPPKLEKKRSAPIPKTIRMEIFYRKDSTATATLLLRVQEIQGQILLYPHEFKLLSLPDELRLVNPPTGEWRFAKAPHVAFMDDLNQAIALDAAPETLETTLLQALEQLRGAKEMNLLLRASLVRQLLDMLSVVSEFYPEYTKPAIVKMDALALGRYDCWMVPDAVAAFASAAELRTQIEALDVRQFRSYRQLENELFTAALERGVAPAGVVVGEKSNLHIHWFEGSQQAREAWLPSMDEKSKKITFDMMPRGELPEDVLPQHWSSAAYPGRVIFAPFDGTDTPTVTGEFAARARKAGISKLQWPQSWPVNCLTEGKVGK